MTAEPETRASVTAHARRRLKVAIVAPSLRILGGQSVQADRLLHAWRDDPAVDAWLVPIDPRAPGPLRLLQRVRYARTIVTQLTYWPLLVREVRQADVVHVFSASYLSFVLAPWPAIRVAAALGKPVVLHYHSGEAPDHLQRSAFARRTLRGTQANVVPSRYLLEVFARFGLDAEAIPNIIDTGRFRFRERRPLRPRLLSTRSFEPHYNVACTLRAFQLIQAQRPDATLTLAGGGPQEPMLRALAGSLGLRHVTFAGRVAPHQMPRMFDEADIYVQTPNLDNMPLSVLEASASGTPIVSTAVGGVPTMVADGEHAMLVPPDRHEAVAAAVLRLLDDTALARRLARQAHEACQACRWDSVRGRWLDTYRSVLPHAGPADALVPVR